MYNYMKSMEAELCDLKTDNKDLRLRLSNMKNNLSIKITEADKQGITGCFDTPFTAGTDQLPAKADQMSCDGSGDVFGQALCKSEAGVTGGRTGLGYGTDLFRILEDEDEIQDYSGRFRQITAVD